MSEIIKPIAQWCAAIIEALGICIITAFALYTLIFAVLRLFKKDQQPDQIFHKARRRLGRGILLGLEFLVASDIIHTVAVELTLKTVIILAIIILIRTFLSFTMEVELTGHLPWKNKE